MLYRAEVALSHADVDLQLWTLSWVAQALTSDPLGVFEANAFYPAPNSLAYSEHFIGLFPFFGPTYLASGNPVLAANATIFSLHVLAGVGLYALARRFVSVGAAVVSCLLYSFYPARLDYLSNFYLLASGTLPLAMLFTERWLEQSRKRDAIGLTVSLCVQLLCSFYLAYAAALAYGLYLALAVPRYRHTLDRRRLLGLSLAVGAACAPLLFSSIPYLKLASAGVLPQYRGSTMTAPGLLPWVTSMETLNYLGGGGAGYLGSALALLGALSLDRGTLWPRVIGVGLVACGVLVSFGPEIRMGGSSIPGPYAILQVLPGFSSMRSSTRMLVVAQLGAAILIALGADRLLAPLAKSRALATTAIVTLCFLTMPDSPSVELHRRPTGTGVPEAYRWLAENGGGRPLLEVPPSSMVTRARRMYLSHAHWLPLLQGYSGYPTSAARYIERQSAGLPSEVALSRLTSTVDVGWILVHLDELANAHRESWEHTLPDGLEASAQFDDDLLVRVTRQQVANAREHLFNEAHTVSGAALKHLVGACRGRLQLSAPLQESIRPASPFRLSVGVTNNSSTAWPALGFSSPHAIRLHACFASPGGSCVGRPTPILSDIPPGGRVKVRTVFRTPSIPGDYELQVHLVQPSTGSLERCGVPPVLEPVRVAPEVSP